MRKTVFVGATHHSLPVVDHRLDSGSNRRELLPIVPYIQQYKGGTRKRVRHKITPPPLPFLDNFSNLDYSATTTNDSTESNDTFSDSSRRNISDAALFSELSLFFSVELTER